MNSKVQIRMEQIARYRITGRMTDSKIAELVGLTPPGLARILALPEYKDLEEALLQGRITTMDQALAEDIDQMKQYYRVGVPLALRALLDGVQQKRDLRCQLESAKELLDRDPNRTFAKKQPGQGIGDGTSGTAGAPGSANAPQMSAEQLATLQKESDAVASQVSTNKATQLPSEQDTIQSALTQRLAKQARQANATVDNLSDGKPEVIQ